MADKAQRPPAPDVEGEDYVWHEGRQAYLAANEWGGVDAWNPASQAWELAYIPGFPGWKPEWGKPPMKQVNRYVTDAKGNVTQQTVDEVDIETAIMLAKWLESREGVPDRGQALQEEIERVEGEIARNQANIGPDENDLALENRLADLKAQYAQWQQSIQPKKEVQNTPLPEGQARIISEDGYDWAYDPATGDYTDFIGKTPEKTKRSTDQMILDYYEAGEFDKAFALDTFRDQIEAPRGLTPYQAATLIMGLDLPPDEMREAIDALTSDWNAVRSTEERVESPGKALLPTAEERNAMPSQAAPAFGAGIPAGLSGAGAGGLQFPDWMTKPGGMPPTGAQFGLTPEQRAALGQQEAVLEEQGGGPSFTPDEIEARKGVFQGVSTTAPTTKAVFDPVAASLAQTYPDMDSAYRVGVEMQGRTGKEYRVVQKDGGYGIIEAPTTTKSIYDPLDDKEEGGVPPGGGYQGPATGQGKVVAPPTGYGPAEQQARTQTGWGTKPWPTPGFTSEGVPISAFTPKGGSNVPFLPMSSELPEMGILPPELLGDLEAQGAASGARVGRYGYSADQFANMPAPANNETEARKKAMGQPYQTVHGYTFAPTLGYKTKQQEIEESNLADLQRRQQTAPAFSTTAPQFQAGQTAAFKRGDIAQFERGLFDTPKPLSIQDTLQQMLYKKWQQGQQAAFKARPVQRSVFK